MNRFKELRKEKGLTQFELAQQLNIDQTTISKWELNKALPDTAMLIKLSNFFNVSTDYLLERTSFYYPDNLQKEPQLNDEEQKLIEDYRSLTTPLQKMIKETIKTFKTSKENLRNKGVNNG